MWTKIFRYWCVPMGTFGFLRSMRGTHEPPHDLLGYKLTVSLLNGIYYASPNGIIPLMSLSNRIQIHLTNRDPTAYKKNYEELLWVVNKNVIL